MISQGKALSNLEAKRWIYTKCDSSRNYVEELLCSCHFQLQNGSTTISRDIMPSHNSIYCSQRVCSSVPAINQYFALLRLFCGCVINVNFQESLQIEGASGAITFGIPMLLINLLKARRSAIIHILPISLASSAFILNFAGGKFQKFSLQHAESRRQPSL